MFPPSFDDLRGRRVLITGASSGIGAAVATAFGHCGARVGVHYNRSEDQARQVVADVQRNGGAAVPLQADLSEQGSGRDLVAQAQQHLGGIDVIVNNAATMVERRPFETIDDDFYSALFDLNVRAAVAVIQAAIPALTKSEGGGVVINTTSLAARTGGGPGTALYAATKGALMSLTIGLARELGPAGIRVNAVSPGVILTRLHERSTSREILERERSQIPLLRHGTVNDCIGAFLFLSSNRLAGFINGVVIEVGGGR